MAKLLGLARVITTSATTGTVTLGAAVAPFLSFNDAGAVSGTRYSYSIIDGTAASESGTGTYTSAAGVGTFARSPTKSTNSNLAITTSGSAQVLITPRLEDLQLPRNWISGLTLSAAGSTATFGIAAGQATDSTNVEMMALASAYTKTTSSWAVGSGSGALDTGAIANSTWYHAYLIMRVDTGVVDVLVSTSASSPTLPTNYTLSRRIGAMQTDGSAQWLQFQQDGDRVLLAAPVSSGAITNPGTAAVTRTIAGIPTGVRVRALLAFGGENVASGSSPGAILFSDLSLPDVAPSSNAFNIFVYAAAAAADYLVGTPVEVMTNTSAQIRTRVQISDASTIIRIITIGWVDRHGQDA